MVAHEDVGVRCNVVFIHGIAQKIMEVASIDVINEDRATVYPALGNMKRDTRELEARMTRHATSVR